MNWRMFFEKVRNCPNCQSAKRIGEVYCDYHLAYRGELLEEEEKKEGEENV